MFRLVYLQIKSKSKYLTLGEKNFLRSEILTPLRGNIVDCNGNLLVSNRPIYNIYWKGSGEIKLLTLQQNILNKISLILNTNFLDENYLKKINYINKNFKKILLKKDITFEQLSQIYEQCEDSYNLDIETSFSRFYLYNNLASHVLGYLSRDFQDYTTKGLAGLEYALQDRLKGETGYVLNVTNSKGRKLDQVDFCKPKQGQDLMLTLDLELQKIAESCFEPDQVGAFILMDPKDGAIKVMTSIPSFDSNLFLKPISQEDWNKYFIQSDVFLNRATTATYPPASIFKIITYAAGIEEGIINPDTDFFCRGYLNFCGRKYHCINHLGHGFMNSRSALAYSCNIPCFEIAQKMNINDLADFAFRFGLGNKTGFLLAESSGLVPTYEWKYAVKGERWWKGDTLSSAIGQSYILVTPIQVVRLIAAVCTGYLVRPRILVEEEVYNQRVPVSSSTLHFLRDALKSVVEIGSAERLNRIKDFDIYAKTGTAQTSSLDIDNKDKKFLEHGWIASYFRYKGESPLAMVVLLEHVGSSGYASRIAAKFLQKYRRFRENGTN
ncbi:hypothetical protein KJ644_02885 [Candidatus Dependentiae bacterium]|nr:hypothetical protein [Candidatus Dependentiae bacterium]MBU4387394.1 hypothetical protein [Candidatus Dependentiae bacterium]MCG2756787.1 hypothetical protein [Candidatus Dependentiae bacterium]